MVYYALILDAAPRPSVEITMINWFDLMRQAQGGAGLENFSRQFGLSPQQTSAAIASLMPAFAMGLQRAAMNPATMAHLFQAMARGPFPAFWDSAAQAFTPQARNEGEHLLDQIFGSDEVCRRVAHQAAAFSGVGVDILQQMLPLLAGIAAGGLTKMAMNQGAMFAGLGAPTQPSGQTGAGAWADLWGQWMGITRSAEPQLKAAVNPYEEMMTSFLRVVAPQPRKKPEPEPGPEPKPKKETEAAGSPFEAWGQMMETGQEMQRQYLASLQTIMDSTWSRNAERP
jgi:hypothetical protein